MRGTYQMELRYPAVDSHPIGQNLQQIYHQHDTNRHQMSYPVTAVFLTKCDILLQLLQCCTAPQCQKLSQAYNLM